MPFDSNTTDKSVPIGMSLKPSSPAHSFVSTLENKSGYACCVLEDFLEANNYPRDYMDIPKEKRLETYFGRKPSRKKIEKRILDSISKLKSNKKRLNYEVEYIHFFQEEGDIFTRDLPFDCCFTHLIVGYAKNLAENGGPKKNVRNSFLSDFSNFRDSYASEFLPEEYIKFMNVFISNFCTKEDVCLRRVYGYADPLFEISIQNFKDWCDTVGLPELERLERGISDAEKIFNYTVTQELTKMQTNA